MSAPSGSATGTVDMVGGPLDELVMALYAYHNSFGNSAEVVHAAEAAGIGWLWNRTPSAEDVWHYIVEIGTNV